MKLCLDNNNLIISGKSDTMQTICLKQKSIS